VGNFFEVYKLLEPNKDTTVKGWEGRTAAETEISDAIARFAALPH
jgi:inorganic pyrophosphatase